MSLDAMLAVFKLPARSCTSSERLLLLAMAESASETGELSAYARSQDFMAFKCGWLTRESVRQLQRSLEKKGLLKCIRRGSARQQADYQLTFIETVSRGTLFSVWKVRKAKEASIDSNGTRPLYSKGNSTLSLPLESRGHISVVNIPLKPVKGSLGLYSWFETQFWPRFPEKVDKLNAWRAMAHLAPGETLRAEILAGVDRALQRAIEDRDDDFEPRLPTPTNWIRGRRWEDWN